MASIPYLQHSPANKWWRQQSHAEASIMAMHIHAEKVNTSW